jgi:hypothetical protein
MARFVNSLKKMSFGGKLRQLSCSNIDYNGSEKERRHVCRL